MQSDSPSSVRIAVLIDADNTSPKFAEALLDEIARDGNPTIRRVYGDWSSTHLAGWTRKLNPLGLQAMHQHALTTRKNSTDSAMIIDAMDLLYSGNVEAFALVTSDSDFTSLALRLRESGKTVYGLGGKRTPASLQNACDTFIRLEVLGEGGDAEDDDADDDDETPAEPRLNLQSALTKAVNATSGEDGWTSLGAIGNHLRRTHAAFDPRMFGHAKLTDLVLEQNYLETTGQGNEMRIRLKGKQSARKAAPKPAADEPQAASRTPRKRAAKKTAEPEAAAPSAPAEKPQPEKVEPETVEPEKAEPEPPKVVKRSRSRKSTTIPASNG